MEKEWNAILDGIESDLIKLKEKSMETQNELVKLQFELLKQKMQPKNPLENQTEKNT